jgi:hypothetical protein
MGFSEKFISWIHNILTTASTSVVLNGVPGKNIICKRGVRQGDPLSPLLFVATAELCKISVIMPGLKELSIYPLIVHMDKTTLSYNMMMTLSSLYLLN